MTLSSIQLNFLRGCVTLVLLIGAFALWGCGEDRVLHKYYPELESGDISLLLDQETQPLPTVMYQRGKKFFAPTGKHRPSQEASIKAVGSQATSDNLSTPQVPLSTFKPDRLASVRGTAKYETVFVPSIAPFKRLQSLDAVTLDQHGVPVLHTSSSQLSPVSLANTSETPDARPRDQFWGSFLLDLSGGSLAALPSISPESQILALKTEPQVPFALLKDKADNFYIQVRSTEHKQIRIVYLMDAPQSFFGGPIGDFRIDTLANEAFKLEPSLQKQALQFARELGIEPSNTLYDALSILVGHFRSFKEANRKVSQRRGIFLDIAKSELGVCRHRTYAFMITALALGIPTRFVHSEAHAWIEIKVPYSGWMRVDLGGALQGLDISGLEERPQYVPRFSDPFHHVGAPSFPIGFPTDTVIEDPAASEVEPENTAMVEPAAIRLPSPAKKSVAQRSLATTQHVWVEIHNLSPSLLRGQPWTLEGQTIGLGAVPMGNITLEVKLAPNTSPDTSTRQQPTQLPTLDLGRALSSEAGYFKRTFDIPIDAELGTYSLSVIPVVE